MRAVTSRCMHRPYGYMVLGVGERLRLVATVRIGGRVADCKGGGTKLVGAPTVAREAR